MKLITFLLNVILTLALTSSPANAEERAATGVSTFIAETESDTDFLPPDQAFQLKLEVTNAEKITAHFQIAKGHYLYKDRIKFSINNTESGIKSISLPEGEVKQDPNFGESRVFHHSFDATLLLNPVVSQNKIINIVASYQGCSEKGLCYAPIHKTFPVNLTKVESDKNESTLESNEVNHDDQATSLLKSGHLWLIVAGFFGFGVLLALTPCVLPMIPILSGIIVGDQKTHLSTTKRLHSFNLSSAYTLGMALSYTLAGILAGLSGKLLSSALQNPWVLATTAIIFVGLAFSMFGFYELRLPSSIENRMVNISNRLKGGQMLGVFLMGAISALIVSPCVAAPLAGALLYISQTHDVLLGGVALFSLSIGMGIPLLLIGASAGHVLPKAGHWMTAVRNFFGILMLAVAIYIVAPVLPKSLLMLLLAALFIIPAVYLNALDRMPATATAWDKLGKGIGIIMLLLGATFLVGAVSGATSPLQPLAGLHLTSQPNQKPSLNFQRIKTIGELNQAIAHASGKTVMLDFYADWCVACKEMEQFTFSNAQVKDTLENVVLLQADVTENSNDDIALLNRFQLFGPPGIIFFNRSGQEIKQLKVIGYEDANKFLSTLKLALSLKDDECNPSVAC